MFNKANVVGILIKAKKHGLVFFDGEIVFAVSSWLWFDSSAVCAFDVCGLCAVQWLLLCLVSSIRGRRWVCGLAKTNWRDQKSLWGDEGPVRTYLQRFWINFEFWISIKFEFWINFEFWYFHVSGTPTCLNSIQNVGQQSACQRTHTGGYQATIPLRRFKGNSMPNRFAFFLTLSKMSFLSLIITISAKIGQPCQF